MSPALQSDRAWRAPHWRSLLPFRNGLDGQGLPGGLGEREWLGLLWGPPAAHWRARAGEILVRRSLPELAQSGAACLAHEHCLDRDRATRLVAAFALARCLDGARYAKRPELSCAEAVFDHLALDMRHLQRERFVVLLLDGRHRLQRVEHVSEGTLTSALVHPREVYRAAIREAAAALIVAHNHPSGDPEPSPEDLVVTRRLHAAGQNLGIPLLDHVIVADRGYVSLRERLAEVFRTPMESPH